MAYISPTSRITSSGLTFAQFQAAGSNGMLEKLIANNSAANAAPTAAPTLAATGTGNTLPAGTYFVAITETDGGGETTASPASASQAVTLGQLITVTFPSLKSGNAARNVYAGTSATVSSMTLVATGITASTYNITAPLPSNSFAVSPPTANTTGIASDGSPEKTRMLRSAESGNLQDDWAKLRNLLRNFNEGKPVNYQELMTRFRNFHLLVAVYDQLCSEVGTLLDSNPGTIKAGSNPIGGFNGVRVWP